MKTRGTLLGEWDKEEVRKRSWDPLQSIVVGDLLYVFLMKLYFKLGI